VTAAVILAAGRSSRMGRPKALLPHTQEGQSFLSYLVRQFLTAGVSTILVVGRPGDEALRDEVTAAGATLVLNPRADDGQLSSLICGLDAAERLGAEQIVMLPVDVPLVSAEAIARLLAHAASSDAPIARATHAGRHGHPVIFKRAVFDELRHADPGVGAKAVIRKDPARVADVDVGDAAVTVDIDTPDDYRRAFGRSSSNR
jgi:CTP:molybdopterin cytidylyltransferase MocA